MKNRNWATQQTQIADDILTNKVKLPTATVIHNESASDKLDDKDSKKDDIITTTDDHTDESGSLEKKGDHTDIQFGQQHDMTHQDSDEPDDFFFDMGYVTMLNATTIYFNCYVEKHTVDQAIRLLKDVNRHIATVEIEYPELVGKLRPKFIINSGGGSVVQGLRLFDRIKNNHFETATIVDGMAASMGIILAVSGAKKQATPNSVLMIHQLSAGASGKFRELMDYAKYWMQLQTKLGNILKTNTKAKKEDIDEFMKGETFILAEDALRMGIIDEIVHL